MVFCCGVKNQILFFKLQKKAIRIITKSHFLAHTEPLFKKESILKVRDLYNCHCLKLYLRYAKNLLPINITALFNRPQDSRHTYPTSTSRSNQINILQPKHVRTENSKRLVSFQIPSLINTLPHILIRKVHIHSFNGFKTYAKKIHFEQGCITGGAQWG